MNRLKWKTIGTSNYVGKESVTLLSSSTSCLKCDMPYNPPIVEKKTHTQVKND